MTDRMDAMSDHDHTGEPTLWCETHQHTHIASLPRFTFACKDCGWGQWYGDQAREHEFWTQENLREAHETYEVEHIMRPMQREITDTQVDAAQIAFHEFVFGEEEPMTRRQLGIARQAWRCALKAARDAS